MLGFGFSFPVDHHTLDSGTLIQWTKGFENPGAVGEDPARLLREAFHRQARPSGVPCRVVCAMCRCRSGSLCLAKRPFLRVRLLW